MWADDAVLKIKSSIFSTLIRPRLNYCCMPSLLLYALGSGEYLRGRCTPLVVGNIFGVDAPFKFVIMFQIDYFIFSDPTMTIRLDSFLTHVCVCQRWKKELSTLFKCSIIRSLVVAVVMTCQK